MTSEKMEEIVCVIITSTTCPKCKIVKENDVEFVEGRKFDKKFYLDLLQEGRVKLIELVYEKSNIFNESITEIYQYSKNSFSNNINVRKYYRGDSNNTIREEYDFLEGWDKSENNKKVRNSKILFDDFIKSTVPERLYNFVHIFPGFILVNAEEWSFGIKHKSFLRAHAVGCVHTMIFEDKNIWAVNNNLSAKDRTYLVDPMPYLEKYLKQPESLSMIPDDLPSKVEDSEEKIKNYVSSDTTLGLIRGNDKEIPFSNGMEYRFVPSDFNIVYQIKSDINK